MLLIENLFHNKNKQNSNSPDVIFLNLLSVSKLSKNFVIVKLMTSYKIKNWKICVFILVTFFQVFDVNIINLKLHFLPNKSFTTKTFLEVNS